MGAELRNRLSWSHSRHETFQSCLRRYFYHYYGSWGGWSATAPPEQRQLYLLKNLKSRQLWAGGIVHEVVAETLARLRAASGAAGPGGPESADGERAAEAAVARMRQEFRLSRSGAYREDPRRIVGLMEHHYQEVVADQVWRETAELVRRAVLGFHTGGHLAAMAGLAPADWLALEELETFPFADTRVYVKMDVAWRTPQGGVRIVDWKTGRRPPRPGGLQLAVYALYAAGRWDLTPAQIELQEVNLNLGAVARAEVGEEELGAAREKIAASVAAMRARLVDVEENRAQIGDFPAEPEPRRCRACPFREVCPEYQELDR